MQKLLIFFLKKKSKILEVGCGEGFACKYFLKKGHIVYACDNNEYIFKKFNNSTLKKINFIKYENFSKDESYFEKFNSKFDCIYSDCVGEHILDIEHFFKNSYKSLKQNGYFIATVPNDNNRIFKHYIKINKKKSILDTKTYSAEHLRFFDKESLKDSVLRIFKKSKFCKVISSYPLERFLINKKYDYYKNNTGKLFSNTVIDFTNFLHRNINEDLINYLKKQADLGIGRDITIIIKK